jgi:peptidoglycan/xylan/chitin deacetylase (PgdA/CDA1 family)
MLNFRNTNIVFAICFLALIAFQYCNGFDVSWFIGLLLLYTAVLFYGSFYIRSNFFLKTFFSGKTKEKIIALSFDDGPSAEFTPQILQTLKAHNVSATFFLIGENAEEQPALVKRIVEEGHLIGNHTFYHGNWFDLQSEKKMKNEMQQTQDWVYQLTGKQMNWFRPPYGVTNPNVKKAIVAMHYQTIGWTIRSFDTMIKDPKKLLARIKETIKPGAIVLLHDTQKTTAAALPDIIQSVKNMGYEIVPLDKLLDLRAYR